MTSDAKFVFGLIAVAAVLMASNRVRFDIVALLVVLALMLSGVLTVGEALSGFGSSVVIIVAGLLVVGEMLNVTGITRMVGDWILEKGGSNETRLLAMIMMASALLGAVMSSTAVVAIFIPIVLQIAARTNLNSSRLLMPMSYAALISGMLTLIATTPNLVVHDELVAAGYDGFGFFSFSLVGLAVLVVAIVYILAIGRGFLGEKTITDSQDERARSLEQLWDDYRVSRGGERLQVGADSPLVGQSISDSQIGTRYRVRILGIQRRATRGEERLVAPASSVVIATGDKLLLIGEPEDSERLRSEQSMARLDTSDRDRQHWLWEMGGVSVLVHPESALVGKTLREVGFRSRYGLEVLGLRHGKQAVADFANARLTAGDSLFVAGPWQKIKQLQSRAHDFVVLEVPAEQAEIVPAYTRMPVAIAILVCMVMLTVLDVVPLVAAVIMAVLAAVFTRCLTMEDSYRAIHWSSVVLVAGMLPLADALDKTGGTQLVVDSLMSALGDSSPNVMLSVIFFLTAALGLFLSNTASAVLVIPIAIYAANAMGVSPYPFAVAVVIAASSAYVTPVSTPVVTLVVEPGRYKFTDFVKTGTPLLFLTYLVTLLLAPIVFPYAAI